MSLIDTCAENTGTDGTFALLVLLGVWEISGTNFEFRHRFAHLYYAAVVVAGAVLLKSRMLETQAGTVLLFTDAAGTLANTVILAKP